MRKSLLSLSNRKRELPKKQKRLKGLVGIKNVELANFITVLAEQKRLLVLPEIYAQYQDLTLIHNNTKSAVIYSAYELSSQQLADVTDILTKRFNSKLDVVAKVAPELIGGIKVEVGDQVLDLSVQGKLNALYATMTN